MDPHTRIHARAKAHRVNYATCHACKSIRHHVGLLAARTALYAPIIHVLDASHTIFVIEGAAFEFTLIMYHGIKHFRIGLRRYDAT